jgi:carboxymethylenebutenolidase
MVTEDDDSPHKLAAKVKCESYFACAEIDKWAPKSDIDILEAALKDAKVPHRIEWYPKAEHGFVFPLRAVYEKPSAERHWERLFDLFRRNLS